MRITSKKTTYLIDANNFVWALSDSFPEPDIENSAREFMNWLREKTRRFPQFEFRVFFDGGFNPSLPAHPGITVSFSEEESADGILRETAAYLKNSGRRVFAVTNDRELRKELSLENVEALWCADFFRLLESAG